MKIRVITTGLIAGFLMSLAALYPAVSLVAPTTIPSLIRPIENDLWHGIALMVSAAAAVFILLDFGIIAARVAGVNDWHMGAKVGGVSGLMVGIVTFVMILSPLLALNAFATISSFQPHITGELPSEALLDQYAQLMLDEPIDWMFMSLLLNAAVGALAGAIYGWRHREDETPKQASLSDHIAAGHHPRTWFGEDTQSTSVAITSGLVLGLVLAFSNIELFAKLADLGRDVVAGTEVTDVSSDVYSPFAFLLVCCFGGIVVYLITNPHTRWRQRVGAVTLAFNIAIIPLLLLSFRYISYIFGLAPYYVVHQLLVPSTNSMPAEEAAIAEFVLLFGQQALREEFFGTAIFALPWLVLLVALISMATIGFLQGAFYAVIIPIMRPRPIDHACSLYQRIRRNPTQVLPEIYKLFESTEDAYAILAHLSLRTFRQDPAVAKLAGYFHTLGTSDNPQEHSQVVSDIYQLTAENPDWRWSTDFGAVFWALHEVLEAHTLEDILKIKPPAEHTTASLPTQIVKSVQLLSNIITEIDKTQRVSDLQTKTIFLENALKGITKAKESSVSDTKQCSYAVSPERSAITITLNHWQETIVDVLQRMKGRALINSTLENQSCTLSAQIPLVYSITNNGLNVAQGVQLRVRESADYHLVKNGHSDVFIDILSPGQQHEAHIPIVPREGVRRLRVEWEVHYDDAVDHDRIVEFADVMEFTDPEKPFTRVFPIPYVTGTPLKSDNVFVGREEIFSFIQENLLGTHQNNAIILHGQRRTGKTSVLYRLGQVMQESHISVLIDMQGKPARSTAEFLFSMADDIAFELEESGIEIDPPEWEDFAENPEFFFRSRFLRSLKKKLGGKNLLLLFDEFEELQQRVESGRLTAEIFPFLRNLVQHESHVDFVFSGTHKLEELGAEYWSILFNIAVYKPITFLSQAEVRHLISAPIEGYNIEYDALAVKRISKVTAGHPYFTQLILHEMMVYHNETERNYFTAVDVDQVLERIVERGEAHFKYIWAESTHEEQLVLRALTDMLMGKDAVHKKELKHYLVERGQEWDEQCEAAVNSLLSRDILDHLGQQSAIYRFKVDLIRLWISRAREAIM